MMHCVFETVASEKTYPPPPTPLTELRGKMVEIRIIRPSTVPFGEEKASLMGVKIVKRQLGRAGIRLLDYEIGTHGGG